MIQIPEELVTLAAERRLIPFIGAGFSASLGLPSWEDMLREVSVATEGALPFDEIFAATNGDLLQVAEYLYLRHDRQIGPIRHQIERSFAAQHPNPLKSGPHVELANLGASQIYTTNYDDIVEQTYKKLNLPMSSVILPKDVALADPDKAQIVKYHGDLAHERTLVLTESAYYKRLDFESPMDLKFRSDLLGKSVLFMGYSFRDVNIRIIWFKLMEMMRDIPEADRRPSYIVRFDSNPALEELYAAVGLRTIVLKPEGTVETNDERTALLGQFLLRLSVRASTKSSRQGSHAHSVFVSQALLDVASDHAERLRPARGARRFYASTQVDDPITNRLLTGVVPKDLQPTWDKVATQILPFCEPTPDMLAAVERVGASDQLTTLVVELLQAVGSEEGRETKLRLLELQDLWPKAWKGDIGEHEVKEVLDLFAEEIMYQANRGADSDIAYLADLVKRVSVGMLFRRGKNKDQLVQRANLLLGEAAKIYPSIIALSPEPNTPPVVSNVLTEVAHRERHFAPVDVDMKDLGRALSFDFRIDEHDPLLRANRVRKTPSDRRI